MMCLDSLIIKDRSMAHDGCDYVHEMRVRSDDSGENELMIITH
jgi:hypothetical protein